MGLRILDDRGAPELSALIGSSVAGTPDINFQQGNPITCAGLEVTAWPDTGAYLVLIPQDMTRQANPFRRKVVQGERITFPEETRYGLGVVLLDDDIGGEHQLTLTLDVRGLMIRGQQPHGSSARNLCAKLSVPEMVEEVPGSAKTAERPFPVTGRPGVRLYLPAGIDAGNIDVFLYHDAGGLGLDPLIGVFSGPEYDRYDARDARGNIVHLNDWQIGRAHV